MMKRAPRSSCPSDSGMSAEILFELQAGYDHTRSRFTSGYQLMVIKITTVGVIIEKMHQLKLTREI